MFFAALATDYDGTLARDGRVSPATVAALTRLKASGRKLVLVTGRELPELQTVFPEFTLFDRVVAENGGLLFDPATNAETVLADPPPPALIARLHQLGVAPLSIGRTIIATWQPNETAVLQAIRELGLELHIIFNKGAVMVLPGNVTKAWGLAWALRELLLSAHNVVGVGDAENDLAFLGACGCAVAVGNALPSVKAAADAVVADHGAGVIELIELLLKAGLRPLSALRLRPALGTADDGKPVALSPCETTLIAGPRPDAAALVGNLLRQMRELSFQFCLVDPEGTFGNLAHAVAFGDGQQQPSVAELTHALDDPEVSVSADLRAIACHERPRFVERLLRALAELRARTGRPHWLVLNLLHQYAPAAAARPLVPSEQLPACLGITDDLDAVAREFLTRVATALAVGPGAPVLLERFCEVTGRRWAASGAPSLGQGRLLLLTGNGLVRALAAHAAEGQPQQGLRGVRPRS